MPISGVIFDLDGVLIDSASPHHESWRLLAKELGARVTEEQFLATFGRQNRDIIPLLFGDDLSQQRIGELSERKEALYRDLVRGRIQPLEGAVELVRGCRREGLKLAIGSSSHPANIDLALQELGIPDCFDAIVHGEEVTRGKPDPQVFLAAAQRLGLAPAACAVIEDAPSGVQAALTAGMTAIGLTTYHPAERLADAHRVIDSLADLTPAAVGSI